MECQVMKLHVVISKEFGDSFANLLNGGILVLSAKTVMKIKKIDKKLKEQFKNYYDVRESYLKELSNKNENGEPIIKDNAYDISKEHLILLNEKMKELLDVDFEIGQKIDYKDIEKVGLSVKDLIILDDIVADPID